MYRHKYTVKCIYMSGALQPLITGGFHHKAELIGHEEHEGEYTEVVDLLTTEDVSRLLDMSDGVIEYDHIILEGDR